MLSTWDSAPVIIAAMESETTWRVSGSRNARIILEEGWGVSMGAPNFEIREEDLAYVIRIL
jgi:hypothetical protein